MTKKCTNCGQEGHNFRTCGKRYVKIFGVILSDKGCDSDGQILSAIQNNKGKRWTEEEHRLFLAGMEKHGKGNWSRISKEFVKTKTPTQVASHSQKHFLRHRASDDKNKHSSIFDLNQTAQSPQDSPVVSPIEAAKTSSEASTSLVPHVCLDDSPPISLAMTYPANYYGIQQMVRNNSMFLSSPSSVPYGYMPYTFWNFATCVPMSDIPSPQLFPHLSGPGTSSAA